jgi:hypothetical protein
LGCREVDETAIELGRRCSRGGKDVGVLDLLWGT